MKKLKIDSIISIFLSSIWILLAIFGIMTAINSYWLLDISYNERKSEASGLINQGMAFASAQEYQKAESAFKSALSILPELPEAYSNLGVIYKIRGRFTEAKVFFNKALDNDISKRYGVFDNLMDIAIVEKDYILAHAMLDSSTSNCPFVIENAMKIGNFHFNISEWDSALTYFQYAEVLRNEPSNYYSDIIVEAKYRFENKPIFLDEIIGIIASNTFEYDPNLYDKTLFDLNLAKDKSYAVNLNKIGFCMAKLEQYENAKEYFQKALVIWEDFADAVDNLNYIKDFLEK